MSISAVPPQTQIGGKIRGSADGTDVGPQIAQDRRLVAQCRRRLQIGEADADLVEVVNQVAQTVIGARVVAHVYATTSSSSSASSSSSPSSSISASSR